MLVANFSGACSTNQPPTDKLEFVRFDADDPVPNVTLQHLLQLGDFNQYLNQPNYYLPINEHNDFGITKTNLDLIYTTKSVNANIFGLTDGHLFEHNLVVDRTKKPHDLSWTVINAYPVYLANSNDVYAIIEVVNDQQQKSWYRWSLIQNDPRRHIHSLKRNNTVLFHTLKQLLTPVTSDGANVADSKLFFNRFAKGFLAIHANWLQQSVAPPINLIAQKIQNVWNWFYLDYISRVNNQSVMRFSVRPVQDIVSANTHSFALYYQTTNNRDWIDTNYRIDLVAKVGKNTNSNTNYQLFLTPNRTQ